MPVRTNISPLEASIVNQVKSYLQSRSVEMQSKKSSTPEDGVNMLTDAIILGINEAFKSPAMQGVFTAIVDTNAAAIIPIGTTAYSAVMIPATAPTVPSPLL